MIDIANVRLQKAINVIKTNDNTKNMILFL